MSIYIYITYMSEDTNKKWLKDVDSLSLKNRGAIVYGIAKLIPDSIWANSNFTQEIKS